MNSGITSAIRPAIGPAIRSAFDGWGAPSLASQVAALFAASEPGVWYDPSDMSAMYQDATGTTPVYMPGQGQVDPPVGLLLDKRLGLARGPELWVDASAQLFGEASRVAPGVYRVYTSTGAYTSVQLSGLIAGEWYELSLNVDLITTLGSGLVCDVTTPVVSFNSVGPKKYLLRTNTNVIDIKRNANVPTDIQISNVSVRRISGNHAYQTTTTSRPTLSARYNLLVSSENLASGWFVFNGAFTQAGDYWKFTENTTANSHSFFAAPSQPKADLYRVTFTGKPAGRSIVRFVLNAYSSNFCEVRFDLAAGTVVGVFTGGDGVVSSYSITPVGDGGYSCTIVGKPSAAASGTGFNVSLGLMEGVNSSYTGDGVSGILVNKFDCRSASDGVGLPPYQRVVDANTYDTAGFPLYLKFDGVDDWLQTASIDFTTTDKVFLAFAYRKLSDAAIGEVFSLSSTPVSSAGTFGMYAPDSAGGTGACIVYARGATTSSRMAVGAAPVSCVAVAQAQIGVPELWLKYNAGEKSLSNASMGGGSLGNYPLYIGRRAGTSLPFNGRLYGLLIRGAATPDATVAKVERYLNSKARIY